MSHQPETSQEMLMRAHATSFSGEQRIELGISPTPPLVLEVLPERYGIPLFELLVVDTRFVFISWEVTAALSRDAEARLARSEFSSRRLVARFYDASEPGAPIAEAELFGDVGRWFVDLGRSGLELYAELGFAVADEFIKLHTAGPVAVPREQVIEPTDYEELRVSYGLGIHGELIILGLRHKPDATWPDVTLPRSVYLTPRPREHPRLKPISGGASGAGFGASNPSSADVAYYSLSSPSLSPRDESDGGEP